MKILVSNDDGINADGLWALVKELKKIARVVVVAPDRERSANGTCVTLRQPLRVQQAKPIVPDVETYAVQGTPSDSVILALGRLVKGKVDMVISGINRGMNVGDDVLISGTVAAALQGYLRGLPALAVSTTWENGYQPQTAARLATLLAQRIATDSLPTNVFLNVNLPDLPLEKLDGAQITRLASQSHIETVEEGDDGTGKFYRLVRQRLDKETDEKTDIWAVEHGVVSITPLFPDLSNKVSPARLDKLCADLISELGHNHNYELHRD